MMKTLVILCSLLSVGFGGDAVTTKYAIGSDVVVAAIRRVQDTCIFGNDLLFMRRVAFQESGDGNLLTNYWNSEMGFSGIWQNDNNTLESLQSSFYDKINEISDQLNVNISELSWEDGDLEIPLNAIAVARLYVYSLPTIPFDLQGQANFWANYYNFPNNENRSQEFITNVNKMTKCKPPGMDLIFIIDSSGSIGEDDFEHARQFMISIITNLQKADQSNRVGIVRFSDSAINFLDLTDDLNAAIQVAKNLIYDGGDTNIHAGLDTAYGMFMRDGRVEVPMVGILITDGQYNDGGDPGPSADDLKSLGVNFFTVGVGTEAPADLKIWASSPYCMFYYSLNGYSQLATVFPELLNAQICEVSAVAPDNQTSVPGSVDKDQSLFYQIPANLSEGVTLRLDISEGAATVYASLTTRLPSSADYDFVANATSENLGQIYISPDDLQNVHNSSTRFISDMVKAGKADVTVYTAVVGLEDSTNFTLHYEPQNTVETPPPTTTTTTTTETVPVTTDVESTTTMSSTMTTTTASTAAAIISDSTSTSTTTTTTTPTTSTTTTTPTTSTSVPLTSDATSKSVSLVFIGTLISLFFYH